jgi:hypothetical protein
MDVDEAIKTVIEIGQRFERQLQLAEEAARIERSRERQRKNARKAAAAGIWR